MKLTEEPQIGRDGKWQLNLYDPDDTRVELMEFTPVEKPAAAPTNNTGPHPQTMTTLRRCEVKKWMPSPRPKVSWQRLYHQLVIPRAVSAPGICFLPGFEQKADSSRPLE